MDPIPSILLRTTCCTVVAGCIASILLRQHTSSRTHRIAAVLVLAQGWAVLPIVVQAPTPIQQAASFETTAFMVPSNPIELNAVVESPTTPPQTTALSASRKKHIIACFVGLWIAGIVAISVRGAYRYLSLVHRLPLGSEPTEREWIDEWESVVQQVNVNAAAVRFRITDNLGPLVCYIPFAFLILAPRRLWASFDSDQRIAMLQHELAHISRGDLWKSVAIRILALPQWFNPLAWQAVRRFDEAAEWACDDLVMQGTNSTSRAVYPSALLSLAKSQPAGVPYSVAASNGDLSTRIRRLVQPRFKEKSQMKKSLALLLLVAVGLLQSIRVCTTIADEPALPAAIETHQDNANLHDHIDVTLFTPEHREKLAIAGLVPYRIGAPDVLAVRLITEEFRGVITSVKDELLVAPDGTIDHQMAGTLSVVGRTTDEVKQAIETKLRDAGVKRQVEVKAMIRNSKAFYVIVEGESDGVTRIPCTPNSNVVTAIESLDLKFPLKKRAIWVSRPQGNGDEDAVFPIDWNKVSRDMKSADYFPLFPTDRVFVGKTSNPDFVTSSDESAIPVPPYSAAQNPDIHLKVQIIGDMRNSLSEFDELMKHGPMVAMVANTQTTLATLRILEKNNLTETLAVPAITCRSGHKAKLSMGDFEMQTVATANDSKIHLETRVCADVKDKTKSSVDTAIELAADEMTLMKVDVGEDGDDEASIYLAITARILR